MAVAVCAFPQGLRFCLLAMASEGTLHLAANLVLSAVRLLAAGLWHLVDIVPEIFGRTSLAALLQGLGLVLGVPLVTAGPGP